MRCKLDADVGPWSTRQVVTALSIKQPWVNLILSGRKTIEVRSWPTRYRGELWLHAGLNIDREACARYSVDASRLVRGAVVGKVEMYDCFEFDAMAWEKTSEQHLNFSQFSPRRYAWCFRLAEPVIPREVKGRLGLMRLNDWRGEQYQ
jgi:ASCH domain